MTRYNLIIETKPSFKFIGYEETEKNTDEVVIKENNNHKQTIFNGENEKECLTKAVEYYEERSNKAKRIMLKEQRIYKKLRDVLNIMF